MSLDVLSIGGALVDLVFAVDFDFIKKFKLKKGSPIERIPLNYLELSIELNKRPFISAGGSAANVCKTTAKLGLNSGFMGKIGRDNFGKFFNKAIQHQGVQTVLQQEVPKKTGRTYVFITPDGDRTMCPFFEANEEQESYEIQKSLKNKSLSKLIFLDSYSLIYKREFNPSLFKNKKHTLALDLSNTTIVHYFRKYFLELIYAGYIQLLFANEEEICALTEIEDPLLACHSLQDFCELIVIMKGNKGSIALSKREFQACPAKEVKVVDRTGVGDAFIGGFLFGYLKKRPLKEALECGSYLAQACLKTRGAELPLSFFKRPLLPSFS